MREYADSTGAAAGDAGRREFDHVLSKLAAKGTALSGAATLQPFRAGFDVARAQITAAIDRLDVRTMPEDELRELDLAMRRSIRDAHARVLGGDQLTEEARRARVQSEDLCDRKLEVFIASGRDKLRLAQESRDFQWKVAMVSLVVGFLLGILSVLVVQSIT